jgi:hypothetical protein
MVRALEAVASVAGVSGSSVIGKRWAAVLYAAKARSVRSDPRACAPGTRILWSGYLRQLCDAVNPQE